MKIKKPSTVYVSFTGQLPRRFRVFHKKHGLLYWRELDGKTPRIKFNLPQTGEYYFNVPLKIEKVVDIEIPQNLPTLPDYERRELKDFEIVDNYSLKGSPARVFVKEGRIERGANFHKLPKPVRAFVLLHEIGHFFYGVNESDYKRAESMKTREQAESFIGKKREESEIKCDLFALINFLKMGYNRSTAFYSLSRVLRESPQNVNRLKALFNNIQKTQNKQL